VRLRAYWGFAASGKFLGSGSAWRAAGSTVRRKREGREITSSACPPSDLDPPPRSGHPGARPSAFCSVSPGRADRVPTPATAAPHVRHCRLIPPLPVAHLDHDDAVLVIAGDAPAAALTFGHGPAPFRGSDAGACDEADLGQRVATAHLQRIPAQEPLRVTGRGSKRRAVKIQLPGATCAQGSDVVMRVTNTHER
jgi:hypothetical protein